MKAVGQGVLYLLRYFPTKSLDRSSHLVSVPSLAAHELQCTRQSCPSILRFHQTATAGALAGTCGFIILDDDINKPKLVHDDTRVHTPNLQYIVFNRVVIFRSK